MTRPLPLATMPGLRWMPRYSKTTPPFSATRGDSRRVPGFDVHRAAGRVGVLRGRVVAAVDDHLRASSPSRPPAPSSSDCCVTELRDSVKLPDEPSPNWIAACTLPTFAFRSTQTLSIWLSENTRPSAIGVAADARRRRDCAAYSPGCACFGSCRWSGFPRSARRRRRDSRTRACRRRDCARPCCRWCRRGRSRPSRRS